MAEMEQTLKNKRILVTGGAGFIGSRLVKALLEHEAQVVAVVDEGTDLTRVEPLLSNPGLHWLRCSLTDSRTLAKLGRERIELVAHLGLRVPGGNGFGEQCLEDITLNLLPTLNLVRSLGESVQGICFASSVAVYGSPARLPVKENDLPSPLSSYAATKLAIECYLRVYGLVNQIPVTILRCATVYGPGELGHRAIPNFLNALSQGQRPLVYGDGLAPRDYIYVDDVVQAMVRALVKRPAQVLNIGSGIGHTSLEIAREVIRLYPADVEPQFLPGKAQEVDLICDISAAKTALDYIPKTSLEEGLREEIEWHKRKWPPCPSKRKENTHLGRRDKEDSATGSTILA
jgi:UDP-glucose 4-epimerase